MPNKQLLEFPGGSIDKGEKNINAARRELAEESGYRAKHFIFLGDYYIDHRRSRAKMHVFLANALRRESREKDEEEEFVLHWYTAEQIDDLIRAGKISNCHVLAPWALYRSTVGFKR